MTPQPTDAATSRGPADGTGAKTALVWLARIVRITLIALAFLHMLLAMTQPVLAGVSLEGHAAALNGHGAVGGVMLFLALVLVPVAVLHLWPGRGSAWPIPLTLLLCCLETAQLALGYAHVLDLHVPLGTLILLLSFVLCMLVLRRPRRKHPAVSGTPDVAPETGGAP